MEHIHDPCRRAWIDDHVIHVESFLQKWTTGVFSILKAEEDLKSSRLENTVSAEELKEIEEICGLDAMRCTNQERVDPNNEVHIPPNVELMTLLSQKKDLEKRKNNKKYLNAHHAHMKLANYPPHKPLKVDLDKYEPLPVEQPDVLLIVQIHTPERRIDPKVVHHAKMPSFHADQEFLVLGCQYLTELRDVIDCISDKAIPGEFSESPLTLPETTCQDIYKSGFFYVNGVFYNDMRHGDCKDYSETIIKWSKGRGIGPFKKERMEKTRFLDLTIQLGYPYVYLHQGECEHIIVFTDLRLFSKHDVNNKNVYPLYTQILPSKRIFCMVCHAYTAMWIVRDNKRLPENPYFFCKGCFLKFNYDADGKKVGEFRAYYLPDRTRLF